MKKKIINEQSVDLPIGTINVSYADNGTVNIRVDPKKDTNLDAFEREALMADWVNHSTDDNILSISGNKQLIAFNKQELSIEQIDRLNANGINLDAMLVVGTKLRKKDSDVSHALSESEMKMLARSVLRIKQLLAAR